MNAKMNSQFMLRLEEFVNEKSIDKFNILCKKIKFRNGGNMAVWFNYYRNDILSLDDENNYGIRKDYELYLSQIKEEVVLSFDEKVEEFIKENNLMKFNFNTLDVKFSDGIVMGRWFSNHKKLLFSLNTKQVEEMKKQYQEYKNSAVAKKRFNERIDEFINIPTLYKFAQNKLNDLVFGDGVSVKTWVAKNMDRILSSNDKKCLLVQEQYKLFNEISIKDKNQYKFVVKLKEFANESNLKKFNYNIKNIRFKDGTVMGHWFLTFKDAVLSGTSVECLMIRDQYNKYKEMYSVKNKVPFEQRLLEFYNEENKEKYNHCNRTVKFSDGASQSIWFSNHFKELMVMDDDISLEILKDYYEFRLKKAKYSKYIDEVSKKISKKK